MKPFEGVLTFVDRPSDSPLKSAKKHRIVLTRSAVRQSLHTLIGKPLNCREDLEDHNRDNVIGFIQSAFIDDRGRLLVYGQINDAALPFTLETLGMSVECDYVLIDDRRADIWQINRCVFSGAAVLKRDKAAYRSTDFRVTKRSYFA